VRAERLEVLARGVAGRDDGSAADDSSSELASCDEEAAADEDSAERGARERLDEAAGSEEAERDERLTTLRGLTPRDAAEDWACCEDRTWFASSLGALMSAVRPAITAERIAFTPGD
jgi:hypothetical protein